MTLPQEPPPTTTPPRRKTVTELTDPELSALYDQLEEALALVDAVNRTCQRHTEHARALSAAGHPAAATAVARAAADVRIALRHCACVVPGPIAQRKREGT